MTFEKKFETLKKSFVKADLEKLTESFAFQVNMTDVDCGGTFYVAYVDGALAVEPYDYKDNTAVVTGAADDVAKLAKGTVAVAVEGNAAQVEMFAASFVKPAAKKAAPAKKPAAKVEKKAEVKAEAKPVAKKAEVKTEAKATKAPAKKTTKK
ncbi:MAG: hypothetical protein UHT63_02785 [Acutalibacteraceae bacterium]|nr:hypothetical protein [Acutalibacteraceae bacterium]